VTAQTRAVLKTYFLRGLRPTQSNYGDLIDSFTLTTETSAFVLKAGDTMTGALILSGNPSVALQAAPKQYVDTFAPLVSPSFTTPNIGVATATSINFGQDPLNYYDEGSWTPIDSSGAGLSLTATGSFTRIGRMVFAYADITSPATANGSNEVIGGLPFTVSNNNFARQGIVSYTDETTLARILVNPNATTFSLVTTAGANLTNATMSTNTMFIMAIYPV